MSDLPLARSQICAVLSPLAVSTCLPSGEYVAESSRAVWPWNAMPVGLPDATLQSRAEPSSLAVSNSLPSAENSTELM